jgi:adenylyl-sulfate kinase
MKPENTNIIPHRHNLPLGERSSLKGHSPAVLWFTGLSGSGKSTIANQLEVVLNQKYKLHTYLLDGDNIRTGLNKDLGFTDHDRTENIRRIAEVARLFYDAGLIIITAFISPFRADRQMARQLIPECGFFEIYVRCPLEICEQRDPKGLYARARQGKIAEFTGIDSAYEPPVDPELVLDSQHQSVEQCAVLVVQHLIQSSIFSP